MCSHFPHIITASSDLLPQRPADQVRSHNKNSLLTQVLSYYFTQSSRQLSMCLKQLNSDFKGIATSWFSFCLLLLLTNFFHGTPHPLPILSMLVFLALFPPNSTYSFDVVSSKSMWMSHRNFKLSVSKYECVISNPHLLKSRPASAQLITPQSYPVWKSGMHISFFLSKTLKSNHIAD